MLCRVLVNGVQIAELRGRKDEIFVGISWARRNPTDLDPPWMPRRLVPFALWLLDALAWVRTVRKPAHGKRVREQDYYAGTPKAIVVGGNVGGEMFAYHLSSGDTVRIQFRKEGTDAHAD